MRSKSSQVEQPQHLDPERRGSRRSPARIGPGGTCGRAREDLEASASEVLRPGTPASAAPDPGGSEGLLADAAALAATLGRPGRAAGVVAAEVASAAPAASVEAEASSRPGASAAVTEPDVVPTAGSGAHVGLRVEVLAAADGVGTFTPSPGGLVAGG